MLNQNSFLRQPYLTQRLRALLAFIWRLLIRTRQIDTTATEQKVVTPARRLHERIPRRSWDSHMHVVNPTNYPLAREATYCPQTYTLEQAMSFEASVGLDNIVLVQPSIYGNDNSCLLNALEKLGSRRGRGVVGFDPQTIPRETLKKWHDLGVRGVRINFSSVGKSIGSDDLRNLLHRYAEDCKPLNWVIQVYMPMRFLPLLEPIVPELGVRICIDHMGHPSFDHVNSNDPYDIQGFRSLIALLEGGKTFVKLSAPYRLSKDGGHDELESLAQELLRLAGKTRLVFATDWPHTRFEGLDIRPWMETVLEWCHGDAVLVERLFRGNAEDLWDVHDRE